MKSLFFTLTMFAMSMASYATMNDAPQYYSSKTDDAEVFALKAPLCAGGCTGYYYNTTLNIIISYNGICNIQNKICHCTGGHGLDSTFMDQCY